MVLRRTQFRITHVHFQTWLDFSQVLNFFFITKVTLGPGERACILRAPLALTENLSLVLGAPRCLQLQVQGNLAPSSLLQHCAHEVLHTQTCLHTYTQIYINNNLF